MAQGIPNDINPNTTSGTDLATLLNEFKDAIVTGFSGTSRPANLQAGGYWVDDTNATEWVMKFYDGTQDIDLFTINLTQGTASIGGGGDLLELLKVSDDILPPELKFLKKRTGLGQSLTNDELGNVTFYGTDSGGLERLQAKFKIVTTDDTSITELGSFFAIEMANTNSATVAEVLRLVDGKIGFGEINPDVKLHIKGGNIKSESQGDVATGPTLFLEKKRTSGNGQVLNNDSLGKVEVQSTDQNGTNFEAASIEVTAVEDQTDVARGNKMTIQTTAAGATTPATRVEIDENGLTVTGTVNATTVTGQLTGENIETTNTSDSTTSPTFIMDKQRVSGNGQVLTNDGIGKLRADSTDVDGDDFEGANIEFFATENHDNTNRGTKVRVQTIGDGATALTTRMEIGETVVIPGNLQVDGTTTTVNSATLDVTDANITVNNTGNQATADAQVSGLTVEMSDATDARIGYDSTLASKFKAGEVGAESEVMTVGATQTNITGKTFTSPVLNTPDINNGTIDGTAITNPSRAGVREGTIADLEDYAAGTGIYAGDGAATNGQLCFATDTKQMFQVIDGALSGVGGGLGSAQTVFILSADDENTVSDFTGQDATFDNGGTIDPTSTLELSQTVGELITGEKKVWKYVAGSSALNDFFGFERAIPQGWRGRTLAYEFTYRTNATYENGDIVFQVKDTVGGSLLIGGAGLALDKAESADGNGKTIRGLVNIPSDGSPIRFGFQNLSSTSGIEFYVDKISFDIVDFNYKNLTEKYSYYISGATVTDLVDEIRLTNPVSEATIDGDKLFIVADDAANSRTTWTALADCYVHAFASGRPGAANRRLDIYVNGSTKVTGNATDTNVRLQNTAGSFKVNVGDVVTFAFPSTTGNSLSQIGIVAYKDSKHVVVDSGEAETEYYGTGYNLSNFWDSTGGTTTFDTSLVPLTDSNFVEWNDTTQTRLVAKQDIEVTVSVGGVAVTDSNAFVYNSSGTVMNLQTARTDANTTVYANHTTRLAAGDYLYFGMDNSATRQGSIHITARKATLGEYHLVPVSDRENAYSAVIDLTGTTASIGSQNSSFITSVSRTGAGAGVITVKGGIFTELPAISIGVMDNTNISNNTTAIVDQVTFNSSSDWTFIYSTRDSTGGVGVDTDFSITLIKQGSDYNPPSVFLGDVPVNYTQTNFLTSNIGGSVPDVADLRFENLVIGRMYRVDLQAVFVNANSANQDVITAVHNGVSMCRVLFDSLSGQASTMNAGTTRVFKAVATTVTFNANLAGRNLVGTGDGAGTYATLTELNHTQETTRF